DVLRDVQIALLRAGRLAIAAGGQDAQGHVVNARYDIPHSHPAPSQADDFVEFPAGLVNAQGQSLDQAIVLVPGNPLISIGIWGQTHMYSRYRCNGCASNTCKESLGRPRSVQNDKAAQGPLCTHRTTVQGI